MFLSGDAQLLRWVLWTAVERCALIAVGFLDGIRAMRQ
jgi:hypothetical protein